MKIRTRLTLQFLLSGAIILILASLTIYFFAVNFRKTDFHNQLKNRAVSVANLLFHQYEVDALRVRQIENENPINFYKEKIIILNSSHDTVFSSDVENEVRVNKEVIRKIEDGYNVVGRQDNNEFVGILYFTNYDMFIILAAANDTTGKAFLTKLLEILLIVCFACIGIFFILGWFYAGRAVKPISNIVEKMETITATNLNLRLLAGKNTDEISRLSTTFNKMLERLEVSFGNQKTFIANASHELRTPLTAINGQLEVLLMNERTTQEYKAEIGSALGDIKSLIDLSNRLLLLARSNSEFPMKDNNKVRIDEIIWQIKEELKKLNKDYNINISIDESIVDFDQMIVIGDEYMLKVAISNVIDNGCKYSPDHTVFIRLSTLDKYIEIEIVDKGIGISDEATKKVFEPFYRGNNTTSTSGFGIGLPLANQIIKNHNGEIKISSQVNKGTHLIIKLPIAYK